MKPFLALALLLLLFSAPFAYVQWSSSASASVAGKVLVAGDKAIYASYDGKVRAVSLQGGTASWIFEAKEPLTLEPLALDGSTIAVVSPKGAIYLISAANGKGSEIAAVGSPVFSSDVAGGRIIVITNSSVIAYSPAGKIAWSRPISGFPGSLGHGEESIYFTSGGKLHALAPGSGILKWSATAADSYLSRPSEYGGAVYFGGTDGRLYSVDASSGRVRFSFQTGGWVMGTPSASSSAVYFGSADGKLYKVSTSGKEIWSFQTGGGVSSEPALAASQGRISVVFGSDDGKLYGLDSATGKEIWSFSTYGKALSATESGGAYLFGTSKGKVYSLSPSPICSFTYPPQNDAVGNWSLEVEGKASSQSGIAGVDVRVAGKQWVAASGTESWHAEIDLSQAPEGTVDIECRARENGGKAETSDFSYITIVKSPNAAPRKMYGVSPTLVAPNETFKLHIYDPRAHDLYGVRVMVGNKEMKGDSPFEITLGGSGPTVISFEKAGYEPSSITVVGQGGNEAAYLLLVAFVVLVAALAYFFFGKKLVAFFRLGNK